MSPPGTVAPCRPLSLDPDLFHNPPPFRPAGAQMKKKRDVRNQSDTVYISVGSAAPGVDAEVTQPRSGRGNNLILRENML